MKQEQVRDFTRKISQSNRSGLIVVIYEIIFAYLSDAGESLSAGNYEGFKESISKAQSGVDELIRSLDFRYEIAKNLYALYVFAKEAMAKAIIKKSCDEAENARVVLNNLYEAFLEAARQDHSAPLMQNTQQVYAGMTYGKDHLTETFQEPASRGFFV